MPHDATLKRLKDLAAGLKGSQASVSLNAQDFCYLLERATQGACDATPEHKTDDYGASGEQPAKKSGRKK